MRTFTIIVLFAFIAAVSAQGIDFERVQEMMTNLTNRIPTMPTVPDYEEGTEVPTEEEGGMEQLIDNSELSEREIRTLANNHPRNLKF